MQATLLHCLHHQQCSLSRIRIRRTKGRQAHLLRVGNILLIIIRLRVIVEQWPRNTLRRSIQLLMAGLKTGSLWRDASLRKSFKAVNQSPGNHKAGRLVLPLVPRVLPPYSMRISCFSSSWSSSSKRWGHWTITLPMDSRRTSQWSQ